MQIFMQIYSKLPDLGSMLQLGNYAAYMQQYRVSEKNVLASGKMLPNVRKKVVKTVSLLFPVSNPVGYAPFERNMN